MKRLSRQQVMRLHTMLIHETGGSHGLRDEGLLDSALNAPFQGFAGENLYKLVVRFNKLRGRYQSTLSLSTILFYRKGVFPINHHY